MIEEVKLVPVVIGEGRVTKIDLPLDGAEVRLLFTEELESPVVLTFKDPITGYYVNIFDHRKASREAFRLGRAEVFEQAFYMTPCLVGFRLKGRTQYFVINDIGTTDMRDGGESESLNLTRRDLMDHERYRVVIDADKKSAIHPATGICLVRPRPR